MKSIKPGRGPSLQGGIASILMGVVGVIWTIGAASIGAPSYFLLFGVVFVLFALVSAGFEFYNVTAKNRHSVVDIVDESEERDPLNAYFGKGGEGYAPEEDDGDRKGFCPYCGESVKSSYVYCPKCGKNIHE